MFIVANFVILREEVIEIPKDAPKERRKGRDMFEDVLGVTPCFSVRDAIETIQLLGKGANLIDFNTNHEVC